MRAFEPGYPPSGHTDVSMAQAAGFLRPIVAGNQVFSMIRKRFVELRYALRIVPDFALKRLIFWNETISFVRRRDSPDLNETLEVRTQAGKTAIVCEIVGARL